ncbi:MAG: sulfite exporter TauE/SafE family protein [Chitinophagaceae bacterium]
MEIIAYTATLVTGMILGMMGGGGSVFALSILVYLLRIQPLAATGYSLFIVGACCLVTGIMAYRRNETDPRPVIRFGTPAVPAVLLARQFLVPLIPPSKQWLIMLLLAAVMVCAAALVFFNVQPKQGEPKGMTVAGGGFLTGLLTGISGAGSGFIIVPVLTAAMGIPLKKAIGSSLLIIAVTAGIGFICAARTMTINWQLLVPLTILALAGSLLGAAICNRINVSLLKQILSVTMLLMALFIIVKTFFV